MCGMHSRFLLGSLMFLLYTADIEKLIVHRGLLPYLYADDTHVRLLPPGQHTSASWHHTVVYFQHRGVDVFKPTKTKSSKSRVLVVYHTSVTPSHSWKLVHNRTCHHSTCKVYTKRRCPYGSRSVAMVTHRQADESMLQSAATSTSHQTFTDDGCFENAN